jgi:DNA-binding HxlR family transcriptional regulator
VPLGKTYKNQACAIARTLEIVGERWALLIVRDAMHGLTRFHEFQRSLGIATNVLSTRLQKLVDAGIFAQPEGRRGGYHLTAKGLDLLPVILSILRWGDTYEQGPDGKEVLVMHESRGHEAVPVLCCERCGDPLTVDDLRAVPGPATHSHLTPPQLAAWGATEHST